MLKNEKGNALVLIIVTFAIIMVFAVTMMFVGESSFKHADKEKNKTQAYYVAKTGADSVIKHLLDKGNEGDMRDELVDLINATNAGDNGEGKYKDGEFEIEVEEETRNGKRVYLVKSTGEIKGGNNEGKDQLTAVLTPEYDSQYSWGTGTVDAGDEVFVKGLHNLEGNGIILNTSKKKELKSSKSPIIIQEGYSEKHEITKLFDGNPDGTNSMHGYKLKRTNVDSTHIISEILEYDSLPADGKPVTLNYGVERKKPDINIPNISASDIKLANKVIDVNSSTPSQGNFVTGSYDIVEFNSSGEPIKKTENKEFLKIEASTLEFNGTNEIKTSRDRDVVIYTKLFTLKESAKLSITGPGKVYIYATDKIDLINSSSLGVDLDVDLEDRVVNTNIHLYIGKSDVQIGNYTEVSNTYIYGKDAKLQLAGNSIYTGRISAYDVAFRDNITLRSPAAGIPNEDHDPIIDFEKIEWER